MSFIRSVCEVFFFISFTVSLLFHVCRNFSFFFFLSPFLNFLSVLFWFPFSYDLRRPFSPFFSLFRSLFLSFCNLLFLLFLLFPCLYFFSLCFISSLCFVMIQLFSIIFSIYLISFLDLFFISAFFIHIFFIIFHFFPFVPHSIWRIFPSGLSL